MTGAPSETPTRSDWSSKKIWAIAALAAFVGFSCCALAGRIRIVHEADPLRYERLANNLLHHGVYSSCVQEPLKPEFERMPGYPAFIAVIKAVAPNGDYPVIFGQALLHGLSVLALFFLARAMTRDNVIATASAFAWALYPFSIHYAISLMSETLAAFGTTVTCAGLVLYLRRRRWEWLGLALFGAIVAVYTRPNLVPLPFVWLAIVLVSRRLRRSGILPGVLALAAGAGLAIAPWMVRNMNAFHRFVPGSHNYLGSNICQASVQFVLAPPQITEYCYGGVQEFLDECDYKENMRYDAIMLERGMVQIRSHPWRTMALATLRPFRLWISFHMQHENRPVLQAAMRWGTLGLFPLFLIGLVQLARKTDSGWVVASTCAFVALVHLPITVAARYSQPVKSLYVLAITYLLVDLWRKRRMIVARLSSRNARTEGTVSRS